LDRVDVHFGLFFSSDAAPGALVILQGENFGDVPGQVWIHLKDWQGNTADYQLLDTQNHWGDTFVAGIVPSISRVLDQEVSFTVVAQCGATSNASWGNFTAARDFVDLAYAAVPPDQWAPWYDCSMSSGVSDHDACQAQGSTNFPPECAQNFPGWGLAPGSLGNLAGYHDSGIGFKGNDGTDQFWLDGPLQNGWALWSTSAEVTTQVSAAGQSTGGQVSVNSFQTSDPGTSNPRLGILYHVNNCGAIFYTGHMIITGPTGVPF
jgi:hypothetical protein